MSSRQKLGAGARRIELERRLDANSELAQVRRLGHPDAGDERLARKTTRPAPPLRRMH